jgi:hypothetical protein
MKRIFKTVFFVAALSFTLVGCNDMSNGGALSGTIADYTAGSVDTIKCISTDKAVLIGKCGVSAKGVFSIILAIPSDASRIGKGPDKVVVSDTTALVSGAFMYVYKNRNEIGTFAKCNYTHTSSTVTVGDAVVMLLYTSKSFTIKGTESNMDGSVSEITTYDLKLSKGWNEVVGTITQYSATKESMTLSSTIPTNLKWRYFSTTPSYIKRLKIPGIR